MPAYDELSTLVDEVNAEVVEFDNAKNAETQAKNVLTAAKTAVAAEKVQLEEKLDALMQAVQARLDELNTPTT